jgi:ATP-binding cassette subfamily B protein
MAGNRPNPIERILTILKFQKGEISSIYIYAILNGLVQLSLPLGIQSIISFVMGGSISTSIIILIILVVLGVFFTGLFQVNQMKQIEKIQQQLFVRYAFEFAHILPRLNLKSVDPYHLPELVNRFFDTGTLQKGLAKLLLDIPTATIQIIFGLFLLSFYHPIFIMFGLLLLLLIYLMLRYSGNKGLEASIEESDHKYEMAGWIEEMARVITSFKFARKSSLHLHKTDEYTSKYLHARTRHFRILLFQYWSLIGFKIAITAAMLIMGSFLLVGQQLNIGQFIAAEIIIIMIISSVEKLIFNLDNVYDVLTAVEKLGKITDLPEEREGQNELAATSTGMAIKVSDLSFAYGDGQPVLKQLNFSIASGDKIQIMGRYGSGKSTLLRLLSGAYQPFEGVINLDGQSIVNYTVQSIRDKTGILLSTQELFQGSLMENITLGRTSGDMTQINALAELIGLKEFIDRQPAGYDLPVDPNGDRLPRRIRLKILLLRALLQQPRLLLLEEPWLGLEPVYAQQIKEYLLNQTNATTVVVSNDTDFAAKASQVVLMEDGEIKAMGKWTEVASKYKTDATWNT